MKKGCEPNCFSTLGYNVAYCYSAARVMKWLWKQAMNGFQASPVALNSSTGNLRKGFDGNVGTDVVFACTAKDAEISFAAYKRGQAALARRRLYPLSAFYTLYGYWCWRCVFDEASLDCGSFFWAGCATWTLVEYSSTAMCCTAVFLRQGFSSKVSP